MQTVVSGVGKFVRAVGQGIDKAGKLFEIHPHEDKCNLKFFFINLLFE